MLILCLSVYRLLSLVCCWSTGTARAKLEQTTSQLRVTEAQLRAARAAQEELQDMMLLTEDRHGWLADCGMRSLGLHTGHRQWSSALQRQQNSASMHG